MKTYTDEELLAAFDKAEGKEGALPASMLLLQMDPGLRLQLPDALRPLAEASSAAEALRIIHEHRGIPMSAGDEAFLRSFRRALGAAAEQAG